jgi:hypothetical protein
VPPLRPLPVTGGATHRETIAVRQARSGFDDGLEVLVNDVGIEGRTGECSAPRGLPAAPCGRSSNVFGGGRVAHARSCHCSCDPPQQGRRGERDAAGHRAFITVHQLPDDVTVVTDAGMVLAGDRCGEADRGPHRQSRLRWSPLQQRLVISTVTLADDSLWRDKRANDSGAQRLTHMQWDRTP